MATYKNWSDKKVPKGWVVVDGWVMPDEVEAFFPGQEFMDIWNPIFYLHDGMWWDLKTHSYTEN